MEVFDEAVCQLNTEQKRAVETIDGPVMVIAGPGTGKTQVLALRIAYILKHTDVGADSVLCLTFTRSGVSAMRDRLARYIGSDTNKVVVSTFHGFAQRLVEKHYELLDFKNPPALLDESASVFVLDEILHAHDWTYLRPRANPASYFNDIKSVVSLLKRENISVEEFKDMVVQEIQTLETNPDNISSRGETKGQLKKEVQTKIESLHKTAEVVDFYRAYEVLKHERALMDYDDVLTYAVALVSEYEDVCADIRENYLYVLVDEHQDSSGIQNAFLTTVWKDAETQNIFVVGDDRQLIYGFGGASINHFTDFVRVFPNTELITLTQNYRSTTPILDLADTLLSSELAQGKLVSNHKAGSSATSATLAQYDYSRDEIIASGTYFKILIDAGVPPHECALLVPKNHHAKSAAHILTSLGVPVTGARTESLFATHEYAQLRRVFQILIDPYDAVALCASLFDPIARVAPLVAHAFLKSLKPKALSLEHLVGYGNEQGLFAQENPVVQWGQTLRALIESTAQEHSSAIVAQVGNTLLVDTAPDHISLLARVEVVRTLIHLALARSEYSPRETLSEFVAYLDRLEAYDTYIPVAMIGGARGVQVMTLHGSKGLEFEHVWIAHMNQSSLMSGRRGGFTLPENLAQKIEKKDEMVAKREVYVAITRAKSDCTISYAAHDIKGADLELAHILSALPDVHFIKKTPEQTTQELLVHGEALYTKHEPREKEGSELGQLHTLVRERYTESAVSVTLLNNFFECPWKWYFRNFIQLPEVKGTSLVFGSAMHSVLETILRERTSPTPAQLGSFVRKELEKEGVEEVNREQMVREGILCIQRFLEKDFDTLSAERATERSLSYRDPVFPRLHMYGKIDLTERAPDGSVSVTDFKTGSSKTKGVIEKMTDEGRLSDYLRQLVMYSYLIAGAEKGTDVAHSRLYFLEADEKDKNRLYSTHITSEHIALLKKDIEDYQNLIESGKWISQTCHFKPYGTSSTECEYCKRAREVYLK